MTRCLLFLLAVSFATAAPPNFLFIMSDDHAAHAMSCYGSKINQTPNLDRIAKAGMRFNNCFVNNSICTPSRAAILTGKYSHLNGVTVFNRFDGSQPHIAKMLQQAGYQTAVIGKWHMFSDPTGFDYWNVLPGQGRYNNPIMIEMGKTNTLKGYATDVITDLSIEYLKKRDRSKPFMLFCHHKAPHREWTPGPKHTNLYENIDIPQPVTFNDNYYGRSRAAAEATMRIERNLTKTDVKQSPPEGLSGAALKQWHYQRYIKDYLRCVASIDDNVGRLLDYLEQSGLAKNTLVIYTSDQGFFLGEHGWYDKRFMYEESLRMPFLISLPGLIKAGSVNDSMILNVDFAPTLLDLAGARIPADMQGRSIAPLLRGKEPSNWRTSMYYRYYHYPQHHRVQPHYGVRTERHKLIYFNKLDEWELYDLKKDPFETNNIYSISSSAGLIKKLKTELFRLKKELKDEDQFLTVLDDGQKFQAVPLERITNVPPDLTNKPFTIGLWITPESSNGVAVAMGGGAHGFSLFLRDGVPHFALRSASELFTVKARTALPLRERAHIAGVLRADGTIQLVVNGKAAASTPAGPITARPRDAFAIGSDPGSPVGPYEAPFAFSGATEDVRVYAGEVPLDELGTRFGL
ncbi:MAG TPA: sulfatase/phosphatase domain-containing protein [Verrucomicrobiae bacterium]|nr:sulfatase/phosphatase domain-containing protein [Verrucomicrobiae bacterium]